MNSSQIQNPLHQRDLEGTKYIRTHLPVYLNLSSTIIFSIILALHVHVSPCSQIVRTPTSSRFLIMSRLGKNAIKMLIMGVPLGALRQAKELDSQLLRSRHDMFKYRQLLKYGLPIDVYVMPWNAMDTHQSKPWKT